MKLPSDSTQTVRLSIVATVSRQFLFAAIFQELAYNLLQQHSSRLSWKRTRGVAFFWRKLIGLRIITRNNTPQAYPAVRCGEAQTGGLLLSGLTISALPTRIVTNTPVMPLHDAHFGGFFVSGVCR